NGQLTGELHARIQLAHVVLNVFGWIGMTALGTLILLWPTVLRARISAATDKLAPSAFGTLVASVAVAAAGMGLGVIALTLAGLVACVAGLVIVAWEGARQWRRRAADGFAASTLACAIGWLLVSVVTLIVATIVSGGDPEAVRGALIFVLPALVVGFIVQLLLGALTYLLPVVLGAGPHMAPKFARELERA